MLGLVAYAFIPKTQVSDQAFGMFVFSEYPLVVMYNLFPVRQDITIYGVHMVAPCYQVATPAETTTTTTTNLPKQTNTSKCPK